MRQWSRLAMDWDSSFFLTLKSKVVYNLVKRKCLKQKIIGWSIDTPRKRNCTISAIGYLDCLSVLLLADQLISSIELIHSKNFILGCIKINQIQPKDFLPFLLADKLIFWIEFIHSKNFIHQNIKSGKLLIAAQGDLAWRLPSHWLINCFFELSSFIARISFTKISSQINFSLVLKEDCLSVVWTTDLLNWVHP